MNIIQDLKRIEKVENEVNELVEKRQYYHELATKITPAYMDSAGGDSMNHSKLDTYMTQSADILNLIERKLAELDALREYWESLIESIEDVNLRRLLRMRYFLYRKWEDIHREIYPNHEAESVRGHCHSRAIKLLSKEILKRQT